MSKQKKHESKRSTNQTVDALNKGFEKHSLSLSAFADSGTVYVGGEPQDVASVVKIMSSYWCEHGRIENLNRAFRPQLSFEQCEHGDVWSVIDIQVPEQQAHQLLFSLERTPARTESAIPNLEPAHGNEVPHV